MKQKLFTFFLALVANVSAIYASDIEVDGIWYVFDSSTKTASVTYRGSSSSSYEGEYSGSVTIPETVTYNGTTYSVTSIGYGAFSYCSSLTSVTIGNSVTSIGVWAFYECSSLTSVTIGNSVTSIENSAFSDCSSLNKTNYTGDIAGWCNIMFGNSYANPMYYSHNFYINDQEIKDLVIPSSVTSIGEYAFRGCSSLTSITIPNSVTSIGSYAFYECSSLTSITIPNSVTSIGSYAFYECSSLTSITIPESVTSIGEYTFYNCSSLTSVTIPNSVTSIGSYAFQGCTSLTSVTIPNSVTSIGYGAFQGCTSLTSVTIPNSVTSIGMGATFQGCTSLKTVEWNATECAITSTEDGGYYPPFYNLSNIDKFTFGNDVTAIPATLCCGLSGLTSIIIPNSVTSIGYAAFAYCSSLASITIPNSVTSIGDRAFESCNNITSVTWNAKNCNTYNLGSQVTSFEFGNEVEVVPSSLCKGMEKLTSVTTPNSLKTIGTSAFEGCVRLGKISLGTGLEEIAANAFAGCTRLYDIYSYATYPPFAEESSFANYNVYVYVPCEYQRDYTLDIVWGKFKFIECIDSEDATTDGNVTVAPGYNDVTITWPTAENADTYSLVINKAGEPFCTLTFNADGQLLNISFAPGRDGNHPVQYAEQTVNGYRFTVTGLTEATRYAYSVTTKDAANQTIATYSGEFTTQSTTAVDNITTNNANIQKIIRDGQFIIVRDGVEYNAVGQELGN